jgi:DNA adenine methylase
MRPPFAYYGGKAAMAARIVDLMPAHRVYIEPFFGSGAVLFGKGPAACEIVNDSDGGLVTFFRALRDQPEDLERICRLTPYARAEYTAADLTAGGIGDLEMARRFWVRVNQSFGKTAGNQTGWSVTTGRTQSVANSVQGRIDRFARCAARLTRVVIECCDAAGLIGRLATADTVIYADPPYLASTRRSRDRARPGDYLHDMGTIEEHERLAEALHATPATVILSGYPSPLYDRLYAGWWQQNIPVKVHASNAVTVARGERTEVLWSNRDLGDGLLFSVNDVAWCHRQGQAGRPEPEPACFAQPCPGGLSWDCCYADDCGVDDDGTGCSLAQGARSLAAHHPHDAPRAVASVEKSVADMPTTEQAASLRGFQP